jgi:hypothetical protein
MESYSVGVIDINGVTSSLEERTSKAVQTLLVGHDKYPVSTVANPRYWVDSFPWLFPFGCGGAEDDTRPTKLTVEQWAQHLLNLEDPRFREDPAFIYVVYSMLKTRARTGMTRILYKKIWGKKDVAVINAPTLDDFKEALEHLDKKKPNTVGPRSPQVQRCIDLLRRIKLVGSHVRGTVFDRLACRDKMMGMITELGLPSLFITLNPSDIHNPVLSFWRRCQDGQPFDLDELLPADFPSSDKRKGYVAQDPVSAALYFDSVIKSFLSAFLGYDYPKGQLCGETIFTGKDSTGLKGFFGVVETQGRGSLHLHILVWLHGFPSPNELIDKLSAASVNDDLLKRITDYLENIIQQERPVQVHDRPDVSYLCQRPSYYGNDRTPMDVAARDLDVSKIITLTNIHDRPCRTGCRRKDGKSGCRFGYPRPIVPDTTLTDAGVLLLKRLDSYCNNYNRTVSSVMRCNTDVSFITNGPSAKSRVFYNTDYLSKSELSVYETLTLAHKALEKVGRSEYSRKKIPTHTEQENAARIRLYTCMNTIDSFVERSGQWVAADLFKLPLEYTTHKFITFTVHSFCQANLKESFRLRTTMTTRAAAENGGEHGAVDEIELEYEESFTPVLTEDSVQLNNVRQDYRLRTNQPTARFRKRPQQQFYSSFGRWEWDMAQMSPYEYKQRVKKTKLNKNQKETLDELAEEGSLSVPPCDTDRKALGLFDGQVLFHPDHPQYKTHVQRIQDCSDPRVPLPIPTLYGYAVPLVTEDPLKYYLMVMSLFTPYQKVEDILLSSDGGLLTWEEAYDTYMANAEECAVGWIRYREGNLHSIRQGKDLQKAERLEDDRLRREQKLDDERPDDPLDGYDYDPGEDSGSDSEQDWTADSELQQCLMDILPKSNHFDETVKLADKPLYDQLTQTTHPSLAPSGSAAALEEGYITNDSTTNHFDLTDKAHQQFSVLLQKTRDAMNNKGGSDSTSGTYHPDRLSYKDILTKNNLDQDQANAFICICKHVLELELHASGGGERPNQMLMFLGGEGGTGKSEVLKSLTEYLTRMGRSYLLRTGAMTGSAAENVGGSTLHTLLGLSINKSGGQDDNNGPSPMSSEAQSALAPMKILFIDEVSMVGFKDLCQISTKLQTAFSNTDPFGGISIIYAGDFYQLPPNGDPSDAMYNLPSTIGTRSPKKKQKRQSTSSLTKKAQGVLLWRRLTHAVFLKTQHRMKNDPEYKDVVYRFRHGECVEEDLGYLAARRIGPHHNPQHWTFVRREA